MLYYFKENMADMGMPAVGLDRSKCSQDGAYSMSVLAVRIWVLMVVYYNAFEFYQLSSCQKPYLIPKWQL